MRSRNIALIITGGLLAATAAYVGSKKLNLQLKQLNKVYQRLKRRAKQLEISKSLRKQIKKQTHQVKTAINRLTKHKNGELARSH